NVSTIPNLPILIGKEGFQNVNLDYLGGRGVNLTCHSLLNKDPKGVTVDVNSSLSHPPGFTPEGSKQENDHIVVPE
ncbi:hypothetical protein Tco_0447345, partial [Tanacetum coccineum]